MGPEPTEEHVIKVKDMGPAALKLLCHPKVRQLKRHKKQRGRNEICHCKSGLKFKKCHGDPRNAF